MQKPSPRFFDLARLKQQIDADNEVPLGELHQRDSKISRQIAEQAPVARLQSWLRHLQPQGSEDHHPEGFIIFWLLVIGLVIGVLSMSGVLFASKEQPVNVLLFLALFVGVQLLLLAISIVSAFLPFDRDRLASPLAFLNPASLLLKRSLNQLCGAMPWASIPQLTRVALMRWSQVLGVAFNLALLATLLVVIAISDRSFGWSSTLNISEAALLGLFETISLPWSWFLESAAVSAQMVSDTRFQSLQSTFDATQVEAMRRWWPFLFTSIACYGLLPRLLLMFVFQALLKRGVERVFLHYPGTTLVLDRLSSPYISTHQAPEAPHQTGIAEVAVQASLPRGQGFKILNWAGALGTGAEQLERLGISVNSVLEAGLDLSRDQQLARSLQQRSESLIVAVKSWEPPLAELEDFLLEINNGEQAYLLLMPLNDRSISASELADWQHFVQRQFQFPLQLVRGDIPQHDQGAEQ